MSDIFLSYARKDRDRVGPIVEQFKAHGWSVWWDPTLRAGQKWSTVIGRALDEAACVVVLWSHHSVQSKWVEIEAAEGRDRDILAPAFLDPVKIPFGFRHLHTEDLSSGGQEGIHNLCASVAEILLRNGVNPVVGHPAEAQPPNANRKVEAPTPKPAAPAKTPEPRVHAIDGLTYIWIPPGTFTMGCSQGDAECFDSERPLHDVTISRGFWICQTPVTQEAYERVMGKNPSRFKGATRPVESVSWHDAQAYCEKTGLRLPTEAEWEYAARAGTTGSRYGNLDEVAWYGNNSGSQTHPVKEKAPNAWGLYDALGNVWEWVSDWYDEGYYKDSPPSDPQGAASGQYRGLRGGSWDDITQYVRVSDRSGVGPTYQDYSIGFRCAGELR